MGRDRRQFLGLLSGLGLSSTLFPGTLWALAADHDEITSAMVEQAARLADITLTPEMSDAMLRGLNRQAQSCAALDKVGLKNWNPPATLFNPVLPGMDFPRERRPLAVSHIASPAVPKNLEEVAFYTARQLGELVRRRRVSSLALTEMYLERLKRYDPLLKFVITYTTDRALAQAKEADRDLAAGRYRGPLHGLPWGAKDLLAVKGYPTTWGALPYKDQMLPEDAAVVQRLDAAGAVLVAKLTLGALAQGDVWFGGITRNPWKPSEGSSGSSAGPASATAAGCVAFSIGSETLGSISSPSTRCGATGLRPTFGRVPRTGAMTLSWTFDKLGPICRAVEDCALVLHAIHGPDGRDRSVHEIPFNWNAHLPLHEIRVGYLETEFANEGTGDGGPFEEHTPEARARRAEQARFDQRTVETLRRLGVRLIPKTLPEGQAASSRGLIINAEAATAFDELTQSGRDRMMEGKDNPFPSTWPNQFRVAHFLPAVEYLNANRARLMLMEQMEELFRDIDVLVTPTNGPQLTITNTTGHPALIQPNGFRASDGTPTSITFLGRLFGEEKLCVLGRAYQEAAGFYLRHPPQLAAQPDES